MGNYVDTLNGGKSEADVIVNRGWNAASNHANTAFNTAQSFIRTASSFNIPFEAAQSGFTAPDIDYSISIPQPPKDINVEFPKIKELSKPTLNNINPLTQGAVPVFSVQPPTIQILNKPSALNAPNIGPAPTITDVTLPDSPAIKLPDKPLMELIKLPKLPDINLPTFSGVAPDGSGLSTPNVGFVWNEDRYDSVLLQDVTNRLTTMLLGGTGLPANIEQAIWDRSRAREDVIARKATQEAYEEFSSRGFSIPPGALSGRISEVQQKNHESVSALSRDIVIKQAELEIDNLKFSVSAGIQLESQMMAYAGQYAARALDAAKITAQVAVDIFNTQVALYNARLQGYQTEASVFKDLIQAESIKLDQYRAEIDAQKLIGDINLQATQIYKTRSEALMAAVDLYKAQMEGVKTKVDVDRARLEGFRATVDAYRTEVEAKSSEYQAWAQSIQGEAAKVSMYEAHARAYGSIVDAYKTGEMVKIENMRAQISVNEMMVKEFSAEVDYLSEQIKAGVAQTNSVASAYEGKARVYSSQVGSEQARVQAIAEKIRLTIAAGTSDAELKLKAAEVNIQQLLRILALEQEGQKAAGSVAGQLAASAMSSFNLSAGVSSSWGRSISNSLNESHSD